MTAPHPAKKCSCNLCLRSRKVKRMISRRDTDKLIEMVTELMNENANMGQDLDYYRTVRMFKRAKARQKLDAKTR